MFKLIKEEYRVHLFLFPPQKRKHMTSYEITKHFPNKNHFGTRSSRLDISLRSLLIRATSREISSKRISAFPKRLERVNRAEGNGGRLSRPISRDKSTGSHCQVHGVSDRPIPIARTFYATDGACVFFFPFLSLFLGRFPSGWTEVPAKGRHAHPG